MPNTVSDAVLISLHDWQQFNSVVAGASATLIGLIFVGLTLGARLVNSETDENIRTYVNPMLMNFILVFVLACVMLIPSYTLPTLAAAITLISAFGLWQTLRVGRTMQRHDQIILAEDNHWLWHFLVPLLSFVLGLIVAIGLIATDQPIWLDGLAIMMLVLITTAIHNIWFLMLWIAQQR